VAAVTTNVLAGRVAWVTGGASGIGRAIAEALADAGADVAVGSLLAGADAGALSYLPDDSELGDVERAVRARGARAFAAALDVRSTDSVSAFHDACVQALGPVDLLINAAGIGGSEAVAGHREETWAATVDVNLTGAFRTIRACLPSMLERGFGRIVNIASTAASVGAPGLAAYCASKAGLLGLTRCVALEGAPSGITCNTISPGQVDTGSTRLSFETWRAEGGTDQTLEDYNKAWKASLPQGRLIDASEIGVVAAFLCRPDAHGVSGADITVAGAAVW
jgi:3-hydroxybutyrate dehydrogenase